MAVEFEFKNQGTVRDDSRYLIATGYPLGLAVKDAGVSIYQVEMNNNVHILNVSAYHLWSCCLRGVTAQKLSEILKVKNVKLIDAQIDYLAKHGLLLSLDLDHGEIFYDELRCYIGFRQGVGLGLRGHGRFFIQNHHLIEVSKEEYIIWSRADNMKCVSGIADSLIGYLQDDDGSVRQLVAEKFLVLLAKGLLFLTGLKNV